MISHTTTAREYAGTSPKVPDQPARLKARQIAALRDVSRVAAAFALYLEEGGEVPYHLDRTSYAKAIDRADEQLRNSPAEVAPCECIIPEEGGDWNNPLPPTPNCPHCLGSGDIEYWTPALGSQPLLFGDWDNPRVDLYDQLTQHEPHQPLALAAYLNGTPSLTDLEELTDGEATAMLERLIGNPTYTLAGWIQHLQGAQQERDGAGWLL